MVEEGLAVHYIFEGINVLTFALAFYNCIEVVSELICGVNN